MASFKQGTYIPVNPHKYMGKHKPKYRSSYELAFFRWADLSEKVVKWSSENVIIPYVSPIDSKVHQYYVDNQLFINLDGKVTKYLVEVKPSKETKPPVPSTKKKKSTVIYEEVTWAINKSKWESAKQWCDSHGYKFLILTENELFSK